jgi:hypothetical protein
MSDQFSNTQQIRKPAVVSKGGIVAAQSRKAAEVGAEVLAEIRWTRSSPPPSRWGAGALDERRRRRRGDGALPRPGRPL